MRIKKKYIPLLMMVALLCATSTYGQKPLTKPEKSQVQAPIIAKSSHKKKQVTAIEDKAQAEESKDETIPEYIHTRRLLYGALKDGGVIGLPDTEEEFVSKLDDAETRKALYNILKEADTVGLPDWDTFESRLSQPKGK